MSKHTPGPWYPDPRPQTPDTRIVSDTGAVAECFGDNKAANARLIAAAPELYSLLSRINTAFYTRTSRKAWLALMEETKPLLQKARGEK